MALGTPPLVCADGAGPELVGDRETGRVLPSAEPKLWADAAHELIVDRPALERLSERAPAAASRFRDDVHAAEMLSIYERVTRSRGLGVAVPDREHVGAPWPG